MRRRNPTLSTLTIIIAAILFPGSFQLSQEASFINIPLVSLGTAGHVNSSVIDFALSIGFTSFDTARATEWYSEDQLALSIAASSIPRSELFITTKIHPRDLGYNETMRAGRESAAKFIGGYVDVLLLHYPRCWEGLCGVGDYYKKGAWKESWRAIEDLRKEGKVRVGGGVSNYGPR